MPEDFEALAITPHMHLLGREITLEVAPVRGVADPALERAPTPAEQLRFFLATQADNRRAGRVPWRFEMVLR